jgi:hypothetical protein
MTKLVLSSSALALVLAIPAVASAQSAPAGSSSCPPGSWFCQAPPGQTPAPAGQALQPLPDPDEEQPTAPPPPPPRPRRYAPPPSQPPVVVYQPPPSVMVQRPESPPPYEYAPPPPSEYAPRVAPLPGHYREWGLNLRLEGSSIGKGTMGNAGMGGGGVGLRFKPNPWFGLETDLDFVGGHGYSGDIRHEQALSFNGLLFLNPRSHAQVYLLAGFGWSWAHSEPDPAYDSTSPTNNYSYFGGQAGIGVELRLTKMLAFNIDVRGMVRTRTDQDAQYHPEFTDPATGQQTNTSGAGILTGGMTLYF